MENNITDQLSNMLKCAGCGAFQRWDPGPDMFKCTHCGNEQVIEPEYAVDNKSEYSLFAAENVGLETMEQTSVKCGGCNALVHLAAWVSSEICPFCASPLVTAMARDERMLRPHAMLPFDVEHDVAKQNLTKWVSKRWFAPSELGKSVKNSSKRLQGVYMPHWRYDANAYANYTGQRGDYYYTYETRTRTVNGKTETYEERVRHTRWTSVAGNIGLRFVDLLISASPSVPQKTADVLTPWDMNKLVDFDERYLSGFRSETYRLDVKEGFEVAQQKMIPEIEAAIRSDIGGDEQRIGGYQATYANVMLQYLLLPVWLCAYQHNKKSYQIVVNARTGEVTGERPYSVIKILFACLIAAAIVLGFVYYLEIQDYINNLRLRF
jgi:uncharacterized CHY-type Zn-finger protein